MMRFENFAICLALMVAGNLAQAQSLPRIRAAYTSIAIQFDPIYIMKELDLSRKYGLDAAVLSEPYATVAKRAGSTVLADLSQLGVPYSMHGFGARKSFIQANRDVVVRFMKAYLEGIYLFKTNKELALNVLRKVTRVDDLSLIQTAYDDYSQRLIPRVPHPNREGIQTIIDQLARSRPQVKALNAADFIDPTILKEIEDSGFVKKLYGN